MPGSVERMSPEAPSSTSQAGAFHKPREQSNDLLNTNHKVPDKHHLCQVHGSPVKIKIQRVFILPEYRSCQDVTLRMGGRQCGGLMSLENRVGEGP